MILTVKKIGNSQGIILPKQIMKMCCIEEKVTLRVEHNQIIISAIRSPRHAWDEQFKAAIANGEMPENDLFEGIGNEFDEIGWTW